MKTTINEYQFRQAFHDMGRGDNFSYEGLTELYDYLLEYELCSGEELELDVIALCCEFTEYKDLEEFNENYRGIYNTIEELADHALVIRVGDESFIIQDF